MNKKVHKVMFGVKVTVGDKTVKVPAIVLEGLHFDVRLGVSWLHKAKASIQVSEGSLVVDTVRIPYKSWRSLLRLWWRKGSALIATN